VEKVALCPVLLNLIDRCDPRTRQCFESLKDYCRGGSNSSRLTELAGKIRHNIVFHYQSETMIGRAIDQLSSRDQQSWVRRGSEAFLWHFAVGDDVVDDVVVRQLWGIDRQDPAQLAAEADNVVDEIYSIFCIFMDFAGDFIWKFSGS
jgi:hypothetical protein